MRIRVLSMVGVLLLALMGTGCDIHNPPWFYDKCLETPPYTPAANIVDVVYFGQVNGKEMSSSGRLSAEGAERLILNATIQEKARKMGCTGIGVIKDRHLFLVNPRRVLEGEIQGFELHDTNKLSTESRGNALRRTALLVAAGKSEPSGPTFYPVKKDAPELEFHGNITRLEPIKGKKGHFKLEADMETDNPELVKTVILGKTGGTFLICR